MNKAGGKEGNRQKTFGTSVYQIIENKLTTKLGYCVIKNFFNVHSQKVPKIRRIEELKKDIKNEKNRNYQLGFVQIIDETNTSKICPNCGYSKNRYQKSCIGEGVLNLSLKNKELQNEDFGIDKDKKREIKITNNTFAYRYSSDGIMMEELSQNDEDFLKIICDTRQNKTKSKDFIRCVHCGFDSRFPKENHEKLEKINGGDTLAAYNIAKRGLEFIIQQNNE